MKKYVGIANAVPDSRTPRRFRNVMTPIRTTAIRTTCCSTGSKADAMLSTAAAIETATVIT